MFFILVLRAEKKNLACLLGNHSQKKNMSSKHEKKFHVESKKKMMVFGLV